MTKDEQNLNLLATFHYVVAALIALFACIPLVHVAMGVLMVANPQILNGDQQGNPPPAWFGYLFAGIGAFLVLLGWAAAFCTFLSGRYLSARRHRMFSFVVAAILCMFMPFGTVLGIFTIIVLSKDSVQQLYSNITHTRGPAG